MSLLAFWRRHTRDLSELTLWKLLHKQGTRRIAGRQPEALARAVERCLGCNDSSKCEALIATDRDAEIETFCPNVMYLRHLAAMKRHEPRRELLGPTEKP